MKYRAGKSTDGDVVQLIKNDAAVAKKTVSKGAAAAAAAGISAAEKAMSAAVGQYSAFLKAYATESAAKPISQLRQLAVQAKTDRPGGPGSAAMSMAAATGAPSAEAGPAEELIALVPAKDSGPLADALQAIVDLPAVPEEKEAARALLKLANPESGATGKKRGREGGRRRKTRRAPKRRATRRRLTFAY